MLTKRGPTLRIVAVNDVYSLENLPRLRSLVEHHASTSPADLMLVTVAGDFVAPSILSSVDSGRGMVDCLNAVGVTHVILGNHEDDIPIAQLRLRVRELNAMCLGTNVHGFDPPLPPHRILEIGNDETRRVRVGLIGVVMTDAGIYRRAPFGAADVEPANAAALREALHLVADERCACVIPLTHQAMADDRDLARAQTDPPFPVIVGGHEHDVHLEQIGGTWLEKAGADAIHAAVIDLSWSPDAPTAGARDLPSVTVIMEDVAKYPENAALRERVNGHMRRVHELEAATLVKLTPGDVLTSIGTRVRQTSMGTLICSRVRDALGARGCLFNGGGIRAAHEYHRHITYGDLKAEVPFDNEVVVVALPGQVLRDAVVASRAHAPEESGGFLQVDDGMIVDSANVLTAINGAPLVLEREYQVALVRDLFFGLDHVEPLVRFAQQHPEKIPPAGSGRDVKLVLVEAFAFALWSQLGGFDVVDANHDGIVTESEVVAAIARVNAEAPSTIAASLVMHALDTNHDQVISPEESNAVPVRARPRSG